MDIVALTKPEPKTSIRDARNILCHFQLRCHYAGNVSTREEYVS